MIEIVHGQILGAQVHLARSESGGWKQDERTLPWCGVTGHGHPGLGGFKVYAGDWMIGVYTLRGRALSIAWARVRRRVAVLLALALLTLTGCASTPPSVVAASPVFGIAQSGGSAAVMYALRRADCDAPPVATSTPAPDASCATIREAWSLQRSNAIRWEGLAKKRGAKLDDARREVADVRAELTRAHERLVEAPPPAPDERGSPLLRILVPFGGAALAGGVAALVCDEVECKPSIDALAVAVSSGVAAGLGALIVEVTE